LMKCEGERQEDELKGKLRGLLPGLPEGTAIFIEEVRIIHAIHIRPIQVKVVQTVWIRRSGE